MVPISLSLPLTVYRIFRLAAPYNHFEEKTYRDLLGVLGDAETKIWAERLFVDPIADIAVLGSPDDQELFDQANDYEALTDGKALVLGEWAATRVTSFKSEMFTL